MFETPCLITMIIAATRMHRYLIDFASKPPDSYVVSSLFSPRSMGPMSFQEISEPSSEQSRIREAQADKHSTDYDESD